MFGLIKKFNRAAVLTDKTWLKKVSEFEGALFPGLEIKAFDRDQKIGAEACRKEGYERAERENYSTCFFPGSGI
jgi:hypothetical protein